MGQEKEKAHVNENKQPDYFIITCCYTFNQIPITRRLTYRNCPWKTENEEKFIEVTQLLAASMFQFLMQFIQTVKRVSIGFERYAALKFKLKQLIHDTLYSVFSEFNVQNQIC